MSNQGGININPNPKTVKSDTKRLSDFKSKVAAVLTQLDLADVSIYVACDKDQYRKPRIGMWRELLADYGLNEAEKPVDLTESFFVGDAGGRLAGKAGIPKDFACSDRSVPD